MAAKYYLIQYNDGADIICAKSIWDLLDKAGLTSYKNEIDRTRVLILSLGLIEFVNDCTSLIREDDFELDILGWAAELEINSFRVAQIVGDEFESTEDYDEEELKELALLELLSDNRSAIVNCIKNKYTDSVHIMKYIGEFYDHPNEENEVSDEYLNDHWDEVKIPGNVMAFF